MEKLFACPTCSKHVRRRDLNCPLCGGLLQAGIDAARKSETAFAWRVIAALVLIGITILVAKELSIF